MPYQNNVGRAFLSAVQISTTEYIAIGGSYHWYNSYWDNGGAATTDVVKYDITTNTFSALAPTPLASSQGGAVLYNGKIYYVCGNNAQDGYVNSMMVYDIALNTWIQKTAMPTASRMMFSMGCCNGKIYLIDGYNGTTATTIDNAQRPMDIYDVATDTWSTQAITGFEV